MRLLTFSKPPSIERHPGLLMDEQVVSLPYQNMQEVIQGEETVLDHIRYLQTAAAQAQHSADSSSALFPLPDVKIHAPLPRPVSLRDFYAFEAHVKSAYANRGKEVPEEWYQFPVFYFSNANAIYGPEETIPYPSYSQALDYEMEIACIIGRAGRDIPPHQAEKHIFGYTIFNDWSARDAQRLEMRVGLGPAKGKDFASSLGPWIVTVEELADRTTGRPGVYDLEMVARVNNEVLSRGNWKDIFYSFGEMVTRASMDVDLMPGDVLGSGTVGTGCLLELTKGQGPWLKPGDVVELEVERLGKLTNFVGNRKKDFK